MRMTYRNLVLVVIFVNGVASNDGFASGFALIENSASGMGNAFAGASAVAEDASTVYFNPAGMTLLEQNQFVGVLHFIRPKSDFSNDNSTIPIGGADLTGGNDDGGRDAFVPNFYYVRSIDSQTKFGLGVNVPFGLATKYDDDWVGRYHGVESDLRALNINPSFAHKVDSTFSIGFGMNLQSADILLSSAIDLGSICYASFSPASCTTMGVAPPQQNDGFATLTGDSNLALGWNLGMLFEFSENSRIGVAYRSKITHHVDGRADFSIPGSAVPFLDLNGAFVDTDLTADVTFPDSFSVSVYHAVNPKITVLADVTWTGWTSFDELRIVYENPSQPDSLTTEDWKNTLRYALGANYQLNDKIMLRGGVAYDETPIRNSERRTPRLPGSDRTWLSFGGSYVYNNKVTVDVGYSHLFMRDAKIDNDLESESPLAPAIAANINGGYTNSVDILSAQFTWKF